MRLISICIPLLLIVACKSTETTKEQKLSFYIRYLAQEQKILAETSIQAPNKDDNLTDIQVPGGIEFNNQPMEIMPYQGLKYRYESPTVFEKNNVFRWDLESERPKEYTVKINPINRFGFRSDTISRTKADALGWEGDPLSGRETLLLLWQNLETNQSHKMEFASNNPIPIADFPAAKIREIEAGIWSLYIVRRRPVRDTLGGMPIEGIIEYFSTTDTLTVIE